ncbi:class I SAM-dependent methyltransferase [Sutcliffiella rhizosphaerae]|uniref:Trans-aconitate 2-methyltransferase n=1 Tax=Sutcliffiella rhizosphaerae TaxID=2880967 RepID=A0ABM8YKX9_9BACI|nr:class I SAM-dependent methyltransferase [Sutcliffiella rhizosphaerae]CAG9620506.1 Trans-aconitate 2-methyltransferase [Sutcliffiella rhizosphaerae]
MIGEYIRLFKARGYMKRNLPFLYSWHAYVGYELDLYEAFKKPRTIIEVANDKSLQEDLLKRWVEVGGVIGYLRKKSKERYQTVKKFMVPASKYNPRSTGVLLKEMMELHIPTLIKYPKIMKSEEKEVFDQQEHGMVVAQTSSLLEQLAIPRVMKVMKKANPQTVVDVGCGSGGYLLRLSRKFPKIKMLGIELNKDVAKEAGEKCREQKQIDIVCEDVHEWSPKEKVDFVMLNNILHYISPHDRLKLFRKVSKWIPEKGVLSVVSPIHNSKHGGQFSSVFNSFFTAFENLYPLPSESDLIELANAANLKIQKMQPVIREGGWYQVTFTKK